MNHYENTTTNTTQDTSPRRQTLHEASKAIKLEARRSLQGNLRLTVGSVVVFCILEAVLILVAFGAQEWGYTVLADTPAQYIPSYVVEFLCDLLLGVLNYGLASIFLCLQYRQPTSHGDLYRGFHENSGEILLVRLVTVLLTTLAHLPLRAVEVYYHIRLGSALPQHETIGIIAYCIAFLIYIVADIWIYYTYAIVWYVLLDYPDLTWREAMRMSRQLMKGNRHVMLYVDLSFLPLYLLATLTCGIAAFWIRAYVEAADAAFYRGLMNARQKKTSR